MQFFGKGKCELTAIVRIFGMGTCKLIANFSATMMTSLPSISLFLSLYYRKCGSASYIESAKVFANFSANKVTSLPSVSLSVLRSGDLSLSLSLSHRAQPHAQSLFSISNSFWYYNLIHFFDEKKDGAAETSIVCFGAANPCHAI